MVAYNFPPDGSAGVHRTLRFVQHLPALSWRARVVSLDTNHYQRYDPGLLDLVPDETDVVRVKAWDAWRALQTRRERRQHERKGDVAPVTADRTRTPKRAVFRARARTLVRAAEAWWYHPDPAMGWIRPAVRTATRLCAEKRPDVIYSTGGPWSSFIVAQRVSERTAIPYVLDFRDSWTMAYNDFEDFRPAWAMRSDRRTLAKLLRGAQAIIFRYQAEAQCYWRAYPGAFVPSHVHIIPNGYQGEPEDFMSPTSERCEILYAGTLPPYRYDTLLQALGILKATNPVRARRLRFIFVGDGMETLAERAAAAGLSEIVDTRETVAYSEVSRLQRSAHALLLLGVKPARGYELCGSKVFSYLKANRPILGIVSPADEMAKILQQVGVSTIADPDSPCEIVSVVQRLLDAWSTGSLAALLPNRAACARYSSERQTAALARALEAREPAEPFVPDSVEIPPSLREAIESTCVAF
jgi:hypothetical protein